ncbi:chloramphenicol resistance leader peptide [Corynebacterium phoceense]|nr:chloramphenicol resistance leader peptide [Corynebacterium amycolatum]MBG9276480.1 chloramphenicol resistance leader peptide [Corynebacterium diphtheriae bv. mitis]RKW76180.1 hypothetical protein D9B42_10185 [Corynebacterium diphtheriae]TYR16819.1 chloramphenicol resistance leader peptide [Corynebacterium urealyticum]MBG9280746.1 chloramphenicol resistance leader peptide [Corynebacterium diphtheriae bv. mitis]
MSGVLGALAVVTRRTIS